MAEIFRSTLIVDVILALMLAELLAFAIARKLLARGPELADVVPNLAAGAALVAALRVVLTEGPWPWLAACLAASLAFHAIDVTRRATEAARSSRR